MKAIDFSKIGLLWEIGFPKTCFTQQKSMLVNSLFPWEVDLLRIGVKKRSHW